MRTRVALLPFVAILACCRTSPAQDQADDGTDLPPPAKVEVDFDSHIKPILQGHCLKCHARGKYKGGLSLETREAILRGGEGGPAAVSGKSEESVLIELVAGLDPVRRMPEKGEPLTREQVGLLRAWIDQGLKWPDGFSFGFRRAGLAPRRPDVPASPAGLKLENPIDRFVARAASQGGSGLEWAPVSDRVFARRVHLDLVGLLPTPERLAAFEADPDPEKRAKLVASLLDDRRAYADHWLTFWNDLLRNAYRGTGFIDDGRKTITGWLYESLYENRPYDQFVHELVSPVPGTEGFTKGIVWRGVVNASQTPAVQAAQNVSQVFLGTNLKCASCHDSFVNDWKLKDAYALASVFAEEPLEIHRCDKPTGEISEVGFIYPELGNIDDDATRAGRIEQLADLLVKPENGRFARTVVNRLWAQLMGRGLVEPLDDMDQPPWDQDLLDWLAADFVEHGHDLKHSLALICTSRAYQLPPVGAPDPSEAGAYAFRGPLVKRMSAEQFLDAVSTVTGIWPLSEGNMLKVDGRGQGGQVAAVRAAIAAAERQESGEAPDAPSAGAKWLWSHADAEKDPGGRILIRKVIPLESVPEKAVLAATCDNELAVFVNGNKVAEGAEWSRPVAVDVTRWLRPGENVVAVEATNWPDREHGRGTTSPAPNPAAFIGWVGGFDGGRQVWGIGSDETWLWAKDAEGDGWKDQPFDADGWQHAVELPLASRIYGARVDLSASALEVLSGSGSEELRAALTFDDPLLTAMGRTNREQVVTRRDSVATTLQALELTNGETLDAKLARGAKRWVESKEDDPAGLIRRLYLSAFGRDPTPEESDIALGLIGSPPSAEGMQDLLWILVMLPEFQLIH